MVGGLSQTQPLLTLRMTPDTPRTFGQRERSISAPNVNLISTVASKASTQVRNVMKIVFARSPVL